MKRWSKLKKKVEALWAPELDLVIHCNSFRHYTNHSHYDLERHWLLLNGNVLWDFPGQFLESNNPDHPQAMRHHPWSFPTKTSEVLDQYLSCPINELLTRQFEEDHYGLGDILRAADRRLGKTRLFTWRLTMPPGPSPALEVLKARFAKPEKAAA